MAKQIYGRIPLWASLSAFFRFSTCNTHPQINIIIIMAARNGTQKPPRAKPTVMGGQQVCNQACRPCNDGGVTVTTQ